MEKRFFKCLNCQFKSTAVLNLNKDDLNQLAQNCVQTHFKPGEIIFKENSFSSNIIYLRKGLAKIHIKGPYKEQIVNVVKSPTYLGLPTAIGDKINNYSATALVESEVCFIDFYTFKNFIFKNGNFAYEIIMLLSKSELLQYKRCVNRTQKQVRGRFSDIILYLSEEIFDALEFDLPLTREELANWIDTSRESISRVLTEFCNEKIISLKGKRIKILDLKLLKQISKYG